MVRGLVPWTEFSRPLVDLRHEVDTLFDQFFKGGSDAPAPQVFAPRTNFCEAEDHYEVTVELPGMKAEDFHIELKEGELWVTGEKKFEEAQQGKTWHRMERYYGQFRRVIPLATAVDEEKIEAEYKHGVLTLKLPKAQSARPKQIHVKTNES